MAEEKKDDKGKDKKKGPSGPSDVVVFLIFMIVLYFMWVWTGGPERSPESRSNQFINSIGIGQGNGETYHEDLFGQPGSVTNTIPFLK